MNAFPSGCNHVYIVNGKIEKVYAEQLKQYSVCWPITRKNVEASILKMLPSTPAIRIPQLYVQSENHIIMEYCKGMPLSKTNWEWISDSIFVALFQMLYNLTKVSLSQWYRYVSPADIDAQQEILACMLKNKTAVAHIPMQKDCLVLGDVSLNNILYASDYFTLLDFECAHWGYQGYDIGQFLAMTQVIKPDAFFHIYEIFKSSIPISYQKKCMYWMKQFQSYYQKTYKKTAM